VTEPHKCSVRQRRGVDVFTLFVGLVALIAAVYNLTDGALVSVVDPRWLLAGVAILVGVVLVVSSLRSRGS